jgi:2',3'-cyclic-nucleotide 2'-phosphodiesterase/3'-nucleotidase
MSRRNPDADDGFRLTVLGTTDMHGYILNWDYFTDAEYDDPAANDVGLAKIASLIKGIRAERGASSTLTLDAGDTIQGTPLTFFYAKVDPICGGSHAKVDPICGGTHRPIHPMAAAMNAIGYDAAALGNHEFNYGIPLLRQFQAQLNHPILAANALDWTTGKAVFDEYLLKRVPVGHSDAVTVGIVGLVTPGCAIWDKANLDGQIRFNGIVEQAAKVIPEVKAAGADIVIVCCHSGANTSSSYGDALPWPENAATLLAEQVPGIDAILVGHAHLEIAERFVVNQLTGYQVLLSEPLKWGMRLTVIDLDVQRDQDGNWRVVSSSAQLLDANTADEDPQIVELIRAQHEQTRTYVNSVVGTSKVAMSGATSRFESTAAIDLINHVQADAVKMALATSGPQLPVLSVASPVSPSAAIPTGAVTIRDIAGLYVYDNTLEAITLTGPQLQAYLEFSAAYFKQITGTGPFHPDELTNAVTPTAPNGAPDYNYDIMGGLDAPLSYDIDIAEPVGSRIKNLAYGGVPISDTSEFIVAINNYRASGGGNFPGVTTAPVVYSTQDEIRQLIIDWVAAVPTIDPADFRAGGWRLVSNGQPVGIL